MAVGILVIVALVIGAGLVIWGAVERGLRVDAEAEVAALRNEQLELQENIERLAKDRAETTQRLEKVAEQWKARVYELQQEVAKCHDPQGVHNLIARELLRPW